MLLAAASNAAAVPPDVAPPVLAVATPCDSPAVAAAPTPADVAAIPAVTALRAAVPEFEAACPTVVCCCGCCPSCPF